MIHGIDTSLIVATELASHPRHSDCRTLLQRLDRAGDGLALAPQVLAEFAHIITDPRRCSAPLPMASALHRANQIWNATEVTQVFPNAAAVAQFLSWMQRHALGRKRLLDTMLAATYWAAGIGSVVTLNRPDFASFGCFIILEP